MGRLADKYGAKPWLMRASWGTAIIYLLMTFVQNVTQLIILKMAQGLFVGLMTISGAIVVQIVPKKEVGKSLGLVAQQAVFQQ
ncbi:MFS transporter [Oenococcus oeni]